MSQESHLSKIVNASGFPLQIGRASLVGRTRDQHGWQVIFSEHAWRNPEDGTSGFLDFALEDRHRSSVLVVECKRVHADAEWVFLQPGDRLVMRDKGRAWVTQGRSGMPVDGSPFKWFDWFDLRANPQSAEAAYCAVSGGGPSLERVAADLVSATEALAHEEAEGQAKLYGAFRAYSSAIVTTARLYVSVFDATKISMSDGKVVDPVYEEVPFVRFRKQLSTRSPNFSIGGLAPHEALARAKEQTVFVINSTALVPFLREFELIGSSLKALW